MLIVEVSATPILDLKQPFPPASRGWIPTAIGLVIGLAIGLLCILSDQGQLPDWHLPPFNGLLLFPALYVAIAIHELGHLVVGRLAGFRTGGLAIGGFVLLKSGAHWTFRFDRRTWAGGGFYKPLSSNTKFDPSRYIWMVAAGPFASLALTVLCALQGIQHGWGAWQWIGSLFWVSLVLALSSAIPFSAGINKSDGKRVWQLWRFPQQALSWMSLLALQTEEANGVRPRDWSSHLVEQMLAIDAQAREYPYCQLMAFYRALDHTQEDAALGHLENALAHSARAGKLLQHILYLEAASASALFRKHAPHARIWQERASKIKRPASLDDSNAAIAMCEERYADAARHWKAAIDRAVRRKLDSGLSRFAKEKWTEYEAACLSLSAGPLNGHVSAKDPSWGR